MSFFSSDAIVFSRSLIFEENCAWSSDDVANLDRLVYSHSWLCDVAFLGTWILAEGDDSIEGLITEFRCEKSKKRGQIGVFNSSEIRFSIVGVFIFCYFSPTILCLLLSTFCFVLNSDFLPFH